MEAAKQILFLSPHPPSATKPRSLEFVREVLGTMEVHFAYLDVEQVPDAAPQLEQLRAKGVVLHRLSISRLACAFHVVWGALGGKSIRRSIYAARSLAEQVKSIADTLPRLSLVHVDRFRTASLAKLLRDDLVLLDMTDMISDEYQFRQQNSGFLLGCYYWFQARLIQQEERAMVNTYVTLLASKHQGLDTSPQPFVVPNIVRKTGVRQLAKVPKSICFIGNMLYWPNRAGVENFVAEAWREVTTRNPELSLTIMGNASERLGKLADDYDNVHVSGFVEDIASESARFELSIAPLQFCNGFPNKVYDSVVKSGVPVLMSKAVFARLVSAERLSFSVADGAQQWIERILAFFADDFDREGFWRHQHAELSREIGRRAYARVLREKFSLDYASPESAPVFAEQASPDRTVG